MVNTMTRKELIKLKQHYEFEHDKMVVEMQIIEEKLRRVKSELFELNAANFKDTRILITEEVE